MAPGLEEAASSPRSSSPRATRTTTLRRGTDAALWEVVQTLPPKARAVVVLRYYEQLSEAETADVLGISVGTVKSQCSRALSALRERVPAELHPRHREEER